MAEVRKIGPKEFHDTYHAVRSELLRVVMGQDEAVDHLLSAVFAGGHVLISGLPGLGRTLLVKTLATVLGLEYRRIQFTPDLLPTDIVGAEVLEHTTNGDRHFRFFKGPVFANLVLADEVNRSPARTQSALLEVMQERQVTSGGKTYFLPKPFTLVATQNTLDTEGVFPLGEAQTDRFMMSIEQDYPDFDSEARITLSTTGTTKITPNVVSDPEMVMAMQNLAREVPVVPSVKQFAVNLVRASRPGEKDAAQMATDSVRLGASPRAAQSLLMGAKVMALARGRYHVTRQDIVGVTKPVLAHRLLMDLKAQAEGRSQKEVIDALMKKAQERSLPSVSRWTRELLKI